MSRQHVVVASSRGVAWRWRRVGGWWRWWAGGWSTLRCVVVRRWLVGGW
ncbi:hypothetical protein ACXZ9C_10745 [Streptococcus agalactiae]